MPKLCRGPEYALIIETSGAHDHTRPTSLRHYVPLYSSFYHVMAPKRKVPAVEEKDNKKVMRDTSKGARINEEGSAPWDADEQLSFGVVSQYYSPLSYSVAHDFDEI
ncbi:hypothetical protein Fot_42349 [Forsythia ovata]|uniref:Uncharacterized protein n=1 Tax=Forsythia ovata TaxID=205694 RepID=A0ABD1RKY6_9LAMI